MANRKSFMVGASTFVLITFGYQQTVEAQNALQAYVVSVCGTPGITLTQGKYGPVFQNTSGTLCTNSTGSAGGGGLAVTDGTSFAAGTSLFTPIGGEYNSSPTALTSGNQGTLALSQYRAGFIDTMTTTSNLYAAITAPAPTIAGTNATSQVAVSNGSTTKLQTDLNGNILIAPQDLTTPTTPAYVAGSYFANVVSSTLTRVSNTATYGLNQTICLFTNTTVCAPMTIAIGQSTAGLGQITRVSLLKSGIATAAATFTIWMFSAAPGTATPNQFDATTYSGPRLADMPNYIGNAACNAPILTSDTTAQVWYDCALSNPNTGGALVFQAASGTTVIEALISVTTTGYVPANAETFKAFVTGFY